MSVTPTIRDSATLLVGPDKQLDVKTVHRIAHGRAVQLQLTEEAVGRMHASRRALDALIDRGEAIYGINTGFGPLVKWECGNGDADRQGAGLIAHLASGFGPWAPTPVVRATMLIRAWNLAHGVSGVGPRVAEALLDLLRRGVHSAVPEIGSLGASGDLAPLSHVAQVVMGRGRVVLDDGRSVPTFESGLEVQPMALSAREALALVNGTSFTSAYAALAVEAADRLLKRAEQATGWLYRLLGCRAQPLAPELHAYRGHEGQAIAADSIRDEASRDGPWELDHRPLQEPYSIRCAPQVLGACRENLEHARRIVTAELNGISDNPIIRADPPAVLHGGNFHGQQLAFAADALNAAMVQAGVLAERQIALLCEPGHTDAGPPLLAPRPGPTSGMAGAQLTATAVLTEMRLTGAPSAFSSIPTNGGNQDIVPMSCHAARRAFQQASMLGSILAVLAMCLAQLAYLRRRTAGDDGVTTDSDWMPPFQPLDTDRPLHDDIRRIAECFVNGNEAAVV